MVANSQNYWEIELSKNSKVEHMGVWVNGDYAIYVELDKIKEILLRTSQSSENSALYYYNKDSNLVNYFKSTSNRYKLAIVQLENAKNNFDLRSLIVYDGMEYKNQNVGNSRVIADQIKHLVEMGNAIVFIKENAFINWSVTLSWKKWEEDFLIAFMKFEPTSMI